MDLKIGDQTWVETAHSSDASWTLGKVGTTTDIDLEHDSVLLVLDVGDKHGDAFWFPRKNLGKKCPPRRGPEGLA